MDEKKVKELVRNENLLDGRIGFYLKKGVLNKQGIVKSEISGHLEKASHNLEFIDSSFKNRFLDWTITGCYYAVYHAGLSLILSKGYSSKNHALCVLIKEFYGDFDSEEFELINNLFLSYNDLLFYVKSKENRELASYSGDISFDEKNVKKIILRTIEFVNKCRGILNE